MKGRMFEEIMPENITDLKKIQSSTLPEAQIRNPKNSTLKDITIKRPKTKDKENLGSSNWDVMYHFTHTSDT